MPVTTFPNIRMTSPSPDAPAFIEYLLGKRSVPARPPMVEYLVDEQLRKSIGVDLLGQTWVDGSANTEQWTANYLDFWYRMGYDYVRYEQGLPFPRKSLSAEDTVAGAERERAWVNEQVGAISTWEEFDKYPWPTIDKVDFSVFEYLNTHLPDGLGLIVSHGGGIFENVSQLLSLEGMGLLLYDNPELVKAISDRIGGLMVEFYEHVHDFDNIVAAFQGDDMGHKTGTLIKPDHLREYCLPWQKRFAEIAHAHGRPYFLHSCGNMVELMPDLIDDVGIDGKHSFEDIIVPIEDFAAQYSDRIASLGGMDIDTLARFGPDEVRARTTEIMDRCSQHGRFAVGSGSSVANYIPVENYLSMLDEAQGWRM
jgi:uroporphyrinogen decarboxylase